MRRLWVPTIAMLALPACPGDDDRSASDVVTELAESVELRRPDEDDAIFQVLFDVDAFADFFDADRVELRVVDGPDSGASFLIVAERENDQFEREDLDELGEFVSDLAASERLEPAGDNVLASACCIARLVDGVAVLAADRSGRLAVAVEAL